MCVMRVRIHVWVCVKGCFMVCACEDGAFVHMEGGTSVWYVLGLKVEM